jgi:hypothetical protein
LIPCHRDAAHNPNHKIAMGVFDLASSPKIANAILSAQIEDAFADR